MTNGPTRPGLVLRWHHHVNSGDNFVFIVGADFGIRNAD